MTFDQRPFDQSDVWTKDKNTKRRVPIVCGARAVLHSCDVLFYVAKKFCVFEGMFHFFAI